jgi:general secretion pathway protein E
LEGPDVGKIETGDAVSVVGEVLRDALTCRASDVHFEPRRDDMLVRLRIDGVLADFRRLPKALGQNVISRLKVLGGLLTYRTDIPQEGRIELPAVPGARVAEHRLAVFPTVHGQRAAVRVFYEEEGLHQLEGLGFSPGILAGLQRLAAAPQGVLLLTGPAGSGKSTTLAAILRHILQRHPGKSLVSLEDPVERHIDGVTQVQVSAGGAMSYPVALRSLLRQDPEVLMIGEIRDAATAAIVVEAGLTGHLLLSTMHSGSPPGAILRLLEMGLEPYQVTSSLQAIVNQRLLRRLCPACRRPQEGERGFEAAGCEQCLHTGYRGRTLVAEMLELDGELRKAILRRADREELEGILCARGHMDLRRDALRLLAQGLTSRQEVVRACGREEE